MRKIASKVYENVDETFFATSGGDDSEVRFFRFDLQFLFIFSSKFITIKRFKNTMSKTQCSPHCSDHKSCNSLPIHCAC